MEEKAAELVKNTNAFVVMLTDLFIRYALSTVGAIVILCAGWLFAGVMQRWTIQSLARIHGIDETLTRFFGALVRYAILIMVFVMVLGQFGVQTASILAALGAAGLAIGLALQGTLQNIAAGIMLLVLRPLRVGESISAGTIVGTVQEIGLFATELKTYDGLYMLVPNSSLWNTPVTNYSRLKTRMHDFKVSIAYDDDIEKAFAIIKDIVDAQRGVLTTPAPVHFVSALNENAVVLCYHYWITRDEYWNVVWNTIKSVKTAFEQEGFRIPYPQTMYLLADKGKKGDVPASAS
ncbi:mechanosensitive ion channel family protein [Methylovirgula sp. 4M-Z18]|uniref:mechanosensitive ion channel family protein n=1 Tax=Methylovirgula sp. 4M-Z18 TaxID=2293567 RepID=UPI000E2FC721|nr:mechanosensitive ion channel domain-containing protein [Methylovirgula sp. 4M-Z18]RFB75705.1 mechanosensitive ion channel family protein [Methylovirgula sp. 4M-Z18]